MRMTCLYVDDMMNTCFTEMERGLPGIWLCPECGVKIVVEVS